MKNNVFSYILVGVISLGVGFYGGILYQKSQQQQRFAQFGQGIRQGQQGRFTGGTRPITGQIIKKDQDSLTIKTQNGSTRIILISPKTSITKSQKTTSDDLKENQNVFVVGQENSDGSITAENIQIGGGLRIRGN